MTTIAVIGGASRRLPATRATLSLTVRVEGEDRADALHTAAAAHTDVLAEIRGFEEAGAIESWSAERVYASSYEQYVGNGEAPVRRHVAAAPVQVVFIDFDALSTWATSLAERDAVAVDGVHWDVSEEVRRRVLNEIAADAVHDAVERATVYARAAGLGEPVLAAVFEPGLRPGVGGGGGGIEMAAMRSKAFDAGGSSIELSPAPIEIAVQISADFTA